MLPLLPETTGQIILKAADGTQTSYSTLAEAIAAAPVNIGKDGEVTQILVTGTVEISETVVIDQNKNISIAAAADGTTIKRAAGFLGDMFKVKDESTSFQFGTGKEGETVLSLTVTGALDQGGCNRLHYFCGGRLLRIVRWCNPDRKTEPVRREPQSVILAEASDWQVVLSQETSLKVL